MILPRFPTGFGDGGGCIGLFRGLLGLPEGFGCGHVIHISYKTLRLQF